MTADRIERLYTVLVEQLTDDVEPGVIDERVVVADAVDGETKWRIVMRRVMQQGASSSTLTKSGAAGLAVTLGSMAAGSGTKPWSMFTDSEYVNPTSSV